ncbi:hypothetical protein PO909_014603, partial [Leuciscus waleckii]
MSVDKMPTAQCSFLHTNTARHTGLAYMKSTQIDCALNVCPQTLRSACLKVSVKTKPTCIRSAQADNALSVVNVPAIPRPHSHIDMTGLTGLAQPSEALSVDHRRGVERGQSARCYQRAPFLK